MIIPERYRDAHIQGVERLRTVGATRLIEKGQDFLWESRILAVADVVEAIATHRPYRPAFGIDAALDEISREKGILDVGILRGSNKITIEAFSIYRINSYIDQFPFGLTLTNGYALFCPSINQFCSNRKP